MPFREPKAGIYATSRGVYNTHKHTFTGRGPAPAGSTKTPPSPLATSVVSVRNPPAAPRTSSPSSGLHLLELNDLLTPGPTAKEQAEAAHRLGVKPKSLLDTTSSAISHAAGAISHDVAKGVDVASQAVKAAEHLPGKRVDNVLGRKTLGTPTVAQILKAALEPARQGKGRRLTASSVISSGTDGRGGLQINRRGLLTIPATRAAAQNLQQARQRLTRTPDLTRLSQRFPELSPAKVKALADAERRSGVPAALLAAISGVESDYGRSTLPGVHSGQNFAGAAGPFQIGNGTGASGNAWDEKAAERWGPQAGQHSIYNFHDAAQGAGQYLKDAGATKDPRSWYNAALSYNHADWYAREVVKSAMAHRGLSAASRPPDPQAAEAFQRAKTVAGRLGIPVKPARAVAALATIPGKGRYVFPFPENKGWTWSRTDQGTDFGYGTNAGAPIRALGSGEIVKTGAPGWPGGGGVLLKLDHAKGLPSPYVFVYEGVEPTVQAGDRVARGQLVGRGGITGSIEIGFADAAGVPLAHSIYTEGMVTPQGQAMTNFLHAIEQGKTKVPVGLLQVGGSLMPSSGGVVSSGGGAEAVVGPSGSVASQRQGSALTTGAPLSALLSPTAPLPAAYQQFQLGEAPVATPESKGIIGQILRRKRL